MRQKKSFSALLLVLLLIAAFLTSCGKKDALPLSGTVNEILTEAGVTNCRIIEIGSYQSFRVSLKTPQLTAADYDRNFTEETKQFGELTDSYVHDEFGYASLAEYRAEIDRRYIENQKIERILAAREEVQRHLFDISEFDMDEKDIVEFSKRMVYREENYAVLYGYDSFEDYLQYEKQLTKEQFLQNCYDEAEREIKRYLLIGALAESEHVSFDVEEDPYETFQNLENAVYDIFLETDADF